MFFHRVKSEGLAAHSYLIGSGKSAAVIDPRRDCEVYLDLAARHAASIDYVFETHRNEDFVIGSLELAERTDAAIYHGDQVLFGYGQPLADGQEFRLGEGARLAALHTPGHTAESFSYVLTDLATGRSPVMVFSGDVLSVGSVGRLDLYGGGGREEEAGGLLYDSIAEKLLKVGEEVILCPAHGGGSVCGSGMAEREVSTLGLERRQNPALQAKGREEFIRRQSAEPFFKPAYFAQMELLNLEGPPLSPLPRPRPLRPREFAQAMEDGALVLDTREPHSWAGAHLRGSYSVWLEGVAPYAGYVLPYGRPLLLVVEGEAQLEFARRSLYRLGYDLVVGYLATAQTAPGELSGALTSWYHQALPIESTPTMSVQGLRSALEAGRCHVLDVRDESEWAEGHIKEAQHIYVGELASRLAEVPRDTEVAVHCSIGRRSGMAVSLLARAGFKRVTTVLGGFGAWRAAGYPVEGSR